MPPVSKCMIGRQATRSKGDLELVKHEHADEPVPEKQGSLFRIARARCSKKREKKKTNRQQQEERSNTQKHNSKSKKTKCGGSKKVKVTVSRPAGAVRGKS